MGIRRTERQQRYAHASIGVGQGAGWTAQTPGIPQPPFFKPIAATTAFFNGILDSSRQALLDLRALAGQAFVERLAQVKSVQQRFGANGQQ